MFDLGAGLQPFEGSAVESMDTTLVDIHLNTYDVELYTGNMD